MQILHQTLAWTPDNVSPPFSVLVTLLTLPSVADDKFQITGMLNSGRLSIRQLANIASV